jgi:hypothetical protein
MTLVTSSQSSRMFHGVRKKTVYHKKKIPTALRNQVWIQHYGEIFRAKCPTTWCTTQITPFSFEAGHNIPESKGGPTILENLLPICSTCNKSMGNSHTFDEWCRRYSSTIPSVPIAQQQQQPKRSWISWLLCSA